MRLSSNRPGRLRRRFAHPLAAVGYAVLLVVGIGVAVAPAAPAAGTGPTIVAVGDIACAPTLTQTASRCQQMATSTLAMSLSPSFVLPLGDNQYETGALSDYQKMYDPSWGRLNSIAQPVPGNHEYGYIHSTSGTYTGAAGYFQYFGTKAHLQPNCTIPATKPNPCQDWYSYNIGTWHVVALDSQCDVLPSGACNPGGTEYTWLKNDLAANPATCTLVYWHIPIFSSDSNHEPWMKPIYALLTTMHADVVLNGHAHFYERFAPQNASGVATPTGPREFIVGTGGRSLESLPTPTANSQKLIHHFGVLQMTLSSSSYSWQFLPTGGGAALDSGSAACVP